jgi:hypothetical protein
MIGMAENIGSLHVAFLCEFNFQIFNTVLYIGIFCFKTFMFTKSNCRESENGKVWYYTTSNQMEVLLNVLDAHEMEAPLVRELLEMKQEINRQMEITERLTNQSKGSRKSYLEVENANIIKQRKSKESDKSQGLSMGLKNHDKVDTDTSVLDGDVVSEVTISSEDTTNVDNDDQQDIDDDDTKKYKNKGKTPTSKKNEESMY